MKIRMWMIALVALTLAACGNLTGNTVARVDSVVLTRQDLDARIGRLEKGIQKQAGTSGQPLPSKLDLVINLKAAKAFCVRIPQSVLLRADRVIE